MNEKVKASKEFLQKCGASMEIKLVGCDIPHHWPGETRDHNHYRFTITTPKGSFSEDFWDSVINTNICNMTFDAYCVLHYGSRPQSLTFSQQANARKALREEKAKAVPTEYDILACLTAYIPETFEEFCWEYGYDNDSIKAFKAYMACQEEYINLRKVFTTEQLKELKENIQEGG